MDNITKYLQHKYEYVNRVALRNSVCLTFFGNHCEAIIKEKDVYTYLRRKKKKTVHFKSERSVLNFIANSCKGDKQQQLRIGG
jgi:uncharacterized protein YcfJ